MKIIRQIKKLKILIIPFFKGNKLKNEAIDAIISNISEQADGKNNYVIFNSTQWTRSEIIEVPLSLDQKNVQQVSHNSNKALLYGK